MKGDAMTPLEFIILLVVAALCGAVGAALSGSSSGGLIVAIALGFIGALIGMLLARWTQLPELFVLEVGDIRFPIVWSIIGATVFSLLVGLFQRRSHYV
jgi:uncharacterized membrane protein YeaQ/YmgE (transglycosylase-associated protein family)